MVFHVHGEAYWMHCVSHKIAKSAISDTEPPTTTSLADYREEMHLCIRKVI